jgi:hypothetical protein
MIQVIYVAGASYSGSTFFGAAVGSHAETMCAGELNAWILSFMHKEKTRHTCACGEMLTRCPFWTGVKHEWLSQTGADISRYQALVQKYERIRSIPSLFLEISKPSSDFQEYTHGTRILFEAISKNSGKQVIIDISKRPGRALALSLVSGIDVKYIHLIRHGLAYVSSTLKHSSMTRPPFTGEAVKLISKASVTWAFTNTFCNFIPSFSRKPYLLLKYEDFVSNPRKALQEIGHFVNFDLKEVTDRIVSGQPVSFAHVTGNSVRTSGSAPLTVDTGWQERLPTYSRLIFSLLAGTLALKYRYR